MKAQSKLLDNQELILAARTGLLPVNVHAWLGGFGNLLRNELGQWWGTRTWWVQILIWVLILNGITTIVMTSESGSPALTLQESVQTFIGLGVMAIGIGTVTAVQNAIVGEKQSGTAAWILSKPASRSGFILAKALGYLIDFWISGILIPSIVFYIEISLVLHASVSILPFVTAVALVGLSQLFYLALTLMLGTLTISRGAIAGIGVGFMLAGLALSNLVSAVYLIATPWLLPDLAGAIALQQALPSFWFVPIVATSVAIVIMLAVALLRFQREEF